MKYLFKKNFKTDFYENVNVAKATRKKPNVNMLVIITGNNIFF